ncbi:MAG TPA: hypothetical protein VEP49_02500, partial [Acidimicrobiia bacterium]|nr:hypothetical protein [Acidimicrobiia bacterium]
GKYTSTLADETGDLVTMRAGDGVHLTQAGGDRLARAVFKLVDAQCHLTAQAVSGAAKQTIETEGSTQVAPGGSDRPGTVVTTPPATARPQTTTATAPVTAGTAPPVVTTAPPRPVTTPPPQPVTTAPPAPVTTAAPPTTTATTRPWQNPRH